MTLQSTIVSGGRSILLTAAGIFEEALHAQQPIIVLLNKIDRIVLEPRFPPHDAYFKLKHTLDEINQAI
jgi:116 kDa U5 small nuclear ribonucleoprotein component